MKKKTRKANHILKQGISNQNGGYTNPRDKHEVTNRRKLAAARGCHCT